MTKPNPYDLASAIMFSKISIDLNVVFDARRLPETILGLPEKPMGFFHHYHAPQFFGVTMFRDVLEIPIKPQTESDPSRKPSFHRYQMPQFDNGRFRN